MFERACWDVGQCVGQSNHYVSLAEIEIITDSLIAECSRQCDSSALDVPQLVAEICTSTLPGMNNGLIIEYCAVPNVGECMQRLQNIAQYWKLELYIPTPTGVDCPNNTWEDNPSEPTICEPAAGNTVDPFITRTRQKQLDIPNH